jgi:hypothetical protein
MPNDLQEILNWLVSIFNLAFGVGESDFFQTILTLFWIVLAG